MKQIHDGLTTILAGFGITLSVTNINDILNLILLICSILNIILILVFKIKDALSDGKITKDEVEDIVNTTKDGIDKIKNETNRNNK